MTKSEIERKINLHELWLQSKAGGECADFSYANLECASLRGVNLEYAIMQDANLEFADLKGANLRFADLRGSNFTLSNLKFADLQGANLEFANLTDATLEGASLQGANLQRVNFSFARMNRAHLKGADIDYSSWTLWCRSMDVNIDKKIAAQLAYHFCRFHCPDKEVIDAQNAIMELANKFHLIGECGKLNAKEITIINDSK
jgi:hypothetical protein